MPTGTATKEETTYTIESKYYYELILDLLESGDPYPFLIADELASEKKGRGQEGGGGGAGRAVA
jgi:hypothetical protein